MMKKSSDHTYTLVLTIRNRPGVLVRCIQVFNRRGHNIEALHVEALPNHSHNAYMTITAFGDHNAIEQITSQLRKLIDVINIETRSAT